MAYSPDSPDSSSPRVTSVSRKYLPLATSYYIRKLLGQNLDRLEFIVASGAGLQADAVSDLQSVLQSLYLEEAELLAAVQELEELVLRHQTLSGQSTQHRQELRNAEQKIFWLLGFKLRPVEHQGTILLVDDNPNNLRLLAKTLTQQGYEVCSAVNGNLALNAVQTVNPDLVLLDVLMPGLDGYDVCQRLKANPLTQPIPVVFISAMSSSLEKVKAFEMGAVDYITKPFQVEEVLARVAHQMTMRNLQRRLEAQNLRLQQEIQARKETEAHYQQLLRRSSLKLLLGGMFRQSPASTTVKAIPSRTIQLTVGNAARWSG
jgi:PleD family two-component response regulator